MSESETSQHTPALSSDELENLGPGCYVQVQESGYQFWTEITNIEGDDFTAVVRNELIANPDSIPASILAKKNFCKKQVTDLGCDNYCFC
ncbi:MAG: hypothetical protein OEZ58_09045 [Gammaproteobacteria bacterium]|nr:hypothetical protein [Gammaproteobacteria bacterium]MDH5729123.1 hypothetical protein [Gammaproteobacteria bacterium]